MAENKVSSESTRPKLIIEVWPLHGGKIWAGRERGTTSQWAALGNRKSLVEWIVWILQRRGKLKWRQNIKTYKVCTIPDPC